VTTYSTFDWNALLERLGGDAEFVRGLLGIALRSSAGLPDELRDACAAADFERLAWLAHKVKGTAGDLVAEPLRVRAQDAEIAARDGDAGAMEQNRALADALDALLADVREACTRRD
jgi:HPt (histidine-containing phosphotransfer) domain-containing protein